VIKMIKVRKENKARLKQTEKEDGHKGGRQGVEQWALKRTSSQSCLERSFKGSNEWPLRFVQGEIFPLFVLSGWSFSVPSLTMPSTRPGFLPTTLVS
jgi:hypothetical protein